jgi:hypothetical protein
MAGIPRAHHRVFAHQLDSLPWVDRRDTLLGLHDPGQPWEKWGCPIDGCGRWFIGPWELEWHTAAEHPGWTATYELLQPYPNQRQRVVFQRVEDPGG